MVMKYSVSIKVRLTFIMTLLLVLVAQFDAPSSAQEPTTTIILGLTPALVVRDTLYAQVARFEAETGIDVLIYDNYFEGDYEREVVYSFQNTPFDVFFVENPMLDKWVTAGYMLPMDGLIEDEDDFYPAVLDSVRVNESLYCIPRNTWSMALFYNRNSFDKAGLEYPTDDWTWDDLRENNQLLLDANSEPLILDNDNTDYWLSFLYQAGGRLTDSETGAWAFNSPEGLESLTFYSDLFQAGRINVEKGAWGGGELFENRAGMTIQGTWMIQLLIDPLVGPHSTTNWGTVELPSYHAEATAILSQCYGVYSQTKNLEASVLLANYLTNAQSQTDLFFRYELPSRKSLAEAYTDYWVNRASEKGLVWHRDDIQTFFDSLQHGFRIQEFEVGYYEYPLADAFKDAFEQVVNGEITVQDMLNQMEAVVITDEP
jgi:multiple sugar transport system substrate-binding protein